MATSTVDRTTSWGPSTPITISKHSSSLQVSNDSKFDACSLNRSSSHNPTGLRESPTRLSLRDPKVSPNAIIDPLDDSDDDRTTTTTTTLPPTTSEGTTVPLPYQLELAEISAQIDRMQQRDDNAPTHRQTTLPTDAEFAALDAKIAQIVNPTTPVPLPYQLELAAISAQLDRMQQRDDNAPTYRQTTLPTDAEFAALDAKIAQIVKSTTPVPPPPATMNLHATEPIPAATADTLPYDNADGDDGNHPPSSIIDTFNLQTKMLRNLNMMVAELNEMVALIVDAITRPGNSYFPGQQIALLLPATTLPTIRPETTSTPTDNPSNTQVKPWPPHHVASSTKLASRPNKTPIPAKPPFNCGRLTRHLVKTRKDSLRPP